MADVVKLRGKRLTQINKSEELKHHKKLSEEANEPAKWGYVPVWVGAIVVFGIGIYYYSQQSSDHPGRPPKAPNPVTKPPAPDSGKPKRYIEFK